MGIRRHRGVPGTLLVCLVLCGLLVRGAGPAAADGTDATLLSATIEGPGGQTSSDSVTLGQLQSGGCPAYAGPDPEPENAPNGREAQVSLATDMPGQSGTWTLASALGCMSTPVPLADVSAIVVLDGGAAESGGDSLLHPADLGTPSDFTNRDEAATISDLGSTLEYDRPARSAADVNFSDQVQSAVGSPIAVTIYEGTSPISVSLTTPARTTIPAGASLGFSATASGGTGSLSEHWSFGGGAAPQTGPSPTARFATAGVYDVSVQVTDGDGDVAQAGPVTITVQSAGATAHTGTTGASRPRPSGAGSAARGSTSGRTSRPGDTPTGTTATRATGTVPATAATSTPAALPAHTGSVRETPNRAGTGAPSRGPLTQPAPARPTAGQPKPAPPTPASRASVGPGHPPRRTVGARTPPVRHGTRVDGRLIATPLLVPVPRGFAPPRPAARGTAATLAPAGAHGPVAALIGVGGMLGLLGAGVAVELRGTERTGRHRSAGEH